MTYTEGFIDFIEEATTPIQSVEKCIEALKGAGFTQLEMADSWRLSNGGAFYVRPFPTTLIAFKIGRNGMEKEGFRLITSHTDSPGFKIKPNPEIPTKGYLKLNTDIYCQPMFYSWMDRPLSVAGHLVLRSDDVFKPRLLPVDIKYPLMTIPSLAIHMNRDVNKGTVFNPQTDMQPLMAMIKETIEAESYLLKLLAKEAGCSVEDILDYDLYLYIQERGGIIGSEQDMISAPRIDNQASVYTSIITLIESQPQEGVAVAACFDNEEIGSATKQGADSELLKQIVERIAIGQGMTMENLYRSLSSSFMISADGAHALHPNAVEKNDPTNIPVINGGVAIKISAKQSYATDGVTSGIFRALCEENGVSYQYLLNRSDIPGGRTLGQMVAKYLPINGVDIGLPMLAMHSARELCGKNDLEDIVKVFRAFYNRC